MKAMIFAAGKGTRLKPLTDAKPKALVELNGVPMLELVIKKLISVGVTELIVNVHYLANQIITFLEQKEYFGIKIEISDETDELLDTGGGLKKASWFFDTKEDFIVYNTDVLSNIDLEAMVTMHKKNNALATLAVRNRESSRYFLFNNDYELCGWKNIKSDEEVIIRNSTQFLNLAFSGIHIINPKIINFMPSKNKFSIVGMYLELSKQFRIQGYRHDKDYWFDVGDLKKLNEADSFLKNR